MMPTSFFSEYELSQLGFQSYGERVLVSRYARIYSPEKISIGNNVRIDDFVILSGNISLGSNIHIAAFCALYGANGIRMEDYSGLSARTTIYSAMDDFSGDFLIGPIHFKEQTNVKGGLVHIQKFVQIGANSVVFPKVKIGEGTVVGAMSFVKESLDSWKIYAGTPCRFIKERSNQLLHLIS